MEHYQNETLKTYDKIAEEFAKKNNQAPMQPMYEKFKQFLPSGRVYDLGCGTGRDANALHLMGYDVFAFDYSLKMLQVAQREYPHIYFQQANILTDFSKNSHVDGVWACASLLHFNTNDFIKSLSIIYDMLNKNGILYMALKLDDYIEEDVIEGRYFRYYMVSEVMEHLESAGFEILHFERSPKTVFGNFFARKK